MKIITPPKLYLDTNHLCSITKVRSGRHSVLPPKFQDAYAVLNSLIVQGRVGLIFQMMAALEWVGGDATLDSAYEIADVFETAPLSYQVEGDTFVFTAELLNECHRLQPFLKVPQFDVFWSRGASTVIQPAIFVLSKVAPDVFHLSDATISPTTLPHGNVPVRLAVERAFNLKSNDPKLYLERIEGFATAMANDFEAIRNRTVKRYTGTDFREWAVRYLSIDRILKALNPAVSISDVLSAIQCDSPAFEKHCPATALFLKYRLKKLQETRRVKKGDVGDAEFLQVVPFSDFVLTDRSHRHFVVEADPTLRHKVYSDPNEVVACLHKVGLH